MIGISNDLKNKLKMIDLQRVDEILRKLKKIKSKHVTTTNGITFERKNENDRWKVVVPETIINQLIQEVHEASEHPGRCKTDEALT